MKHQILFSGKNKLSMINLLSADFVQRVLTVNFNTLMMKHKPCDNLLNFLGKSPPFKTVEFS